MQEIKVYRVSETDWIAARSLSEAVDFYKNQCDGEDDPDHEPYELDVHQMTTHEHRGEDGTEYDPPITFQEELERNIADGVEFPCLFATTEI